MKIINKIWRNRRKCVPLRCQNISFGYPGRASGTPQPIILRTYIDGEVIDIDDTQQFVSDANIGTSWEPYVIDLLNPSVGVTKVTIDDATDDDDWWSIQGFKLDRKPTQPGVYIHRGKKITVRRNDSATAISLKKDK